MWCRWWAPWHFWMDWRVEWETPDGSINEGHVVAMAMRSLRPTCWADAAQIIEFAKPDGNFVWTRDCIVCGQRQEVEHVPGVKLPRGMPLELYGAALSFFVIGVMIAACFLLEKLLN